MTPIVRMPKVEKASDEDIERMRQIHELLAEPFRRMRDGSISGHCNCACGVGFVAWETYFGGGGMSSDVVVTDCTCRKLHVRRNYGPGGLSFG